MLLRLTAGLVAGLVGAVLGGLGPGGPGRLPSCAPQVAQVRIGLAERGLTSAGESWLGIRFALHLTSPVLEPTFLESPALRVSRHAHCFRPAH